MHQPALTLYNNGCWLLLAPTMPLLYRCSPHSGCSGGLFMLRAKVLKHHSRSRSEVKIKAEAASFSVQTSEVETSMLANIYRFDETDLEANRAGLLSNKQIAVLRRQQFIDKLAVMLSAVVFTTFMLFWIIDPASRLIILFIPLFCVFVIVVCTLQVSERSKDLKGGIVNAIQGQPKLTTQQMPRTGRFYVLTIGKTIFTRSKPYSEFTTLKHVRIYYTPHRKKIVSTEP